MSEPHDAGTDDPVSEQLDPAWLAASPRPFPMVTMHRGSSRNRFPFQQDGLWLAGREMLLEEIDRRIGMVRLSAGREEPAMAFRTGLLIFLERRVSRLNDTLQALRGLRHPISDGRCQVIDRMLSSLVETLRHAELEPACHRKAGAH